MQESEQDDGVAHQEATMLRNKIRKATAMLRATYTHGTHKFGQVTILEDHAVHAGDGAAELAHIWLQLLQLY